MSSTKENEISHEKYKELFEVDKSKSELRQKALDIVLDIRKFEIELYWKRATYFWTFIAAALTGFITIQQLGVGEKIFWSVLVGCLGFVFSVAWYCVNRGSKHWQENWENHADLLENSEIGPLYKVVLSRPKHKKPYWHPKGWWPRIHIFMLGPGPFSVSKINQIISLFSIILWVGLIVKVLPPFSPRNPINHEYAIPIGISFFIALFIFIKGRTDKDPHDDLIAIKRKTTLNNETKQ